MDNLCFDLEAIGIDEELILKTNIDSAKKNIKLLKTLINSSKKDTEELECLPKCGESPGISYNLGIEEGRRQIYKDLIYFYESQIKNIRKRKIRRKL